MIEIRWHGRGGQGAFTAAKILGSAITLNEDKFALSFPSFGPERRGAPIQAFTKIDNKQIINRSEIIKSDYMVFLDETLFNFNALKDLKENGKVILNSENNEKYNDYKNIITIDASKIAMEILKMPITNTAMLGALIAISNIANISSVQNAISEYLPSKVVDKNIQVLQMAYKEVQDNE